MVPADGAYWSVLFFFGTSVPPVFLEVKLIQLQYVVVQMPHHSTGAGLDSPLTVFPFIQNDAH